MSLNRLEVETKPTQRSGLFRRLRGWIVPVRARHANLSAGSTVNMQLWLAQMPWRPAALWGAVAGVLSASDFLLPLPLSWPTLVLLFLLVDPLWGAVWRLAAGRAEVLPLNRPSLEPSMRLPYLTPDSPAAHLLGANTSEMWPVLFRVALPALAVALLVASALGVQALILTGLLLLITVFGWISTRRAHHTPVLLHNVVSIGLPWLLAARLAGANPDAVRWPELVLMIVLWVGHEWGAGRMHYSPQDHLGIFVLGLTGVVIGALLVWLRSPLWLSVWFVCMLPTWLLVIQKQRSWNRADVWRLVAMLASAVAVGQSLV